MSRRREKNVGVIGLGIIGSRVAQNLRRRGFHVFVWNRTPRPFPNFVGARSEVAELCDLIQIFVSDDDALLETVEAMKRSLKANHIVMAHSTVAPHTMRAAAEIVQRRGAQFLDAPFTGSKGAAENGELVYYLGGDEAAFRRARPALEASSKEIVEIGEIGQATTVKVATNMITAATVQAAAEALALVHSTGLSPDKFAAAMRGNGSNSGTLTMKLPKMIEGDFEPHFSVKHMLKDVQIASRLGRSHGLNFGATEAARDSLRSEMAEGRGDLDYSAVVQVYFPEGSPAQAAKAAAAAEEQQTLGGLDEEPPKKSEDRAKEPAAEEEPAVVAPKDEKPVSADAVEESDSEKAKTDSDSPKPAVDSDDEPRVKENEPAEAKASSDVTETEAETESVDDKSADDGDDEPTAPPAEPEIVPEVVDEDRDVREPEMPPEREAVAAGAGEAKTSGNGDVESRRGLFSRMFGKGDV